MRTSGGGTTPLDAFRPGGGEPSPLQVMPVAGGIRPPPVGFDTAPGVSLGEAVDEIRHRAHRRNLPAALTLRMTGAAGASRSR